MKERAELIKVIMNFYGQKSWDQLDLIPETFHSADASVNLSLYRIVENIKELLSQLKTLALSLGQPQVLEQMIILNTTLAQELRSLRINVLSAEGGHSNDTTQILHTLEKLIPEQEDQLRSSHELIRKTYSDNN